MIKSTGKKDLRVVKTRKALTNALYVLLCRNRFSKISVYEICAEAMVSRSAFYTHFSDKYALLEQWLTDLRREFSDWISAMSAEQLEDKLCETFLRNTKVFANLLGEADFELLELLFTYLTPDICLSEREKTESRTNLRQIALSDFFAGGLFGIILRQVNRKQNSEEEIRAAISFSRNMVKTILDLYAAQTD
ncbi:MAG: TetR/AcrR family transcriptional regulator [Oscillospiraceae bacterium]|jgi:AcrR family transcriptional regulator|nr:TetR/AcrR family transcriptional regulator [Oscillospiraceae bacterium]